MMAPYSGALAFRKHTELGGSSGAQHVRPRKKAKGANLGRKKKGLGGTDGGGGRGTVGKKP